MTVAASPLVNEQSSGVLGEMQVALLLLQDEGRFSLECLELF